MLMPSIFGENLFDDFMSDFPFFDDRDLRKTERKLYGHNAKRLMKTDIKETDSGFELEMDLPGFKKDEIKVSLDNGYMTVSAAKGLDKDEQRYTGSCSRSFYVGDAVTEEDIKAKFENGTLKMLVPKKEEQKAVENKKYIAIEG